MIVFTVIGVVCVAFLALNLAMTKWDHHKLRQQQGRMVPLEEYRPLRPSQFAPYVPPNQPEDALPPTGLIRVQLKEGTLWGSRRLPQNQ